jgi:hypothetical protein
LMICLVSFRFCCVSFRYVSFLLYLVSFLLCLVSVSFRFVSACFVSFLFRFMFYNHLKFGDRNKTKQHISPPPFKVMWTFSYNQERMMFPNNRVKAPNYCLCTDPKPPLLPVPAVAIFDIQVFTRVCRGAGIKYLLVFYTYLFGTKH